MFSESELAGKKLIEARPCTIREVRDAQLSKAVLLLSGVDDDVYHLKVMSIEVMDGGFHFNGLYEERDLFGRITSIWPFRCRIEGNPKRCQILIDRRPRNTEKNR